jgi:hypothetical protein
MRPRTRRTPDQARRDFAAGLFPDETPRERAFRKLAEFRTAWHKHHGVIISSDEARARMASVRAMARTEAQVYARTEGGGL